MKRKRVLTEEVVEIKSMEWRDETLKVQWERCGTYLGPGGVTLDQITMSMFSSFHFNGVKIKDQTIARDVNAFLQATGQVRS